MADAFRVTWPGKVFESPGHSSRLHHQDELPEKTWEDAVQEMNRQGPRQVNESSDND